MIREGATVGRYVLERRLGRGGFGEVWLAHDASIARKVALKFLTEAAPEDLERFRREARIAGGLEHPSIAAVYEVGEHGGTAYIAMQFVEGRTLGAARLERREAIRLVRDAARAVHEAHERGIVHRDLKPDNLMVSGDRVYVMDFGLARQMSVESSLSRTGTVLGTPVYMPPEQARGDLRALGPRSDVYSLGATLYDLISGRPPFEGEPLKVLIDVVDHEPAPLLGVDPALAAIVSTCLAKDPSSRYATAAALAADLTAWLEGRPVSVKRRWRLHPLVWAAGVLIVAGIATWAVVKRTETATVETRTQALSNLRETARVCFDAAMACRRAGRIDDMEAHAQRLKAACDAVSATMPEVAEPHVLMARMRRAQRRSVEALAEAEKAVACEPSNADALTERGAILLARYRDRLGEGVREWRTTRGLESADARARMSRLMTEENLRTKEMEELLTRALSDLRAARTPLAAALEDACALRRDTEAVRKALEEAPENEDLAVGCAIAAASTGDFARAIGVLTRAIERDAGSLALLHARRQVWSMWADAKTRRGEPAQTERLAAVRDADGCLRITADPDAGLLDAVTVRVAAGLFEDAVAQAEAALKARPTPVVRMACVLAHGQWAYALSDADPAVGGHLDAASKHLDRLEEQAPNARVQVARLSIAMRRLQAQVARRGDAAAAVADAKRQAEDGVRRFPGDTDVIRGRAGILKAVAIETTRHGPPDEAAFDVAAKAYRDHLIAHGRDDAMRVEFALMLLEWIAGRWNAGRAVDALVDEALSLVREMLALDDGDVLALGLRGRVNVLRALQKSRSGQDAGADLRAAIEDISVALKAQPGDLVLLLERSSAFNNLAFIDAAAGRDPVPAYESAERDIAAMLEAGAPRAPQVMRRGKMRSDRAAWETRTGRDPAESHRGAAADLEEAAALAPEDGLVWIYLGGSRVNVAIWKAKEGGEPADLFKPGIEALDKAIQLRRQDDLAWRFRGQGYYSWGAAVERRRGDPRELYRAALSDWEQAVKLNPSHEASLKAMREHAKRRVEE